LDANKPHVINAEMHFADGFVARREVVIAGEAISDSVSSELTPVVVTGDQKATSLDGCFSAHGKPLRARTAETDAEVAFVREPNVNEYANTLDPDRVVRNGRNGWEIVAAAIASACARSRNDDALHVADRSPYGRAGARGGEPL